MTDTVQSLVSSLKGVINVVPLTAQDKDDILALEESYEHSQSIKLINSGVKNVLRRGSVLALLKDTGFRKPPAPTVLMVEEVEATDAVHDNIAFLDGKWYRIVGEEIFNRNDSFQEEHIFISSGFVLFPERRKNREHIPSYFLMPSVAFPELEHKDLDITDIISASPSSLSDDYLRDKYKLSKDNQLATILVGFNDAS